MRLLLIGCEYSGKTTLAVRISRWMIDAMGVPFVRWHNHYVAPCLDRHMVVWADDSAGARCPGKQEDEEFDDDELDQLMALKPSLLEQFTRHLIWRHLHPDMYREPDVMTIDGHYADAVYAPIYYGYGEPGSFADRTERARAWDAEMLSAAPDTVLVLVTAAADTIRRRLRASPRPRGILKADDVSLVLARFDEEYESSLVARRFTLDTTEPTADEILNEFVEGVQPYLTQDDVTRMAGRARS